MISINNHSYNQSSSTIGVPCSELIIQTQGGPWYLHNIFVWLSQYPPIYDYTLDSLAQKYWFWDTVDKASNDLFQNKWRIEIIKTPEKVCTYEGDYCTHNCLPTLNSLQSSLTYPTNQFGDCQEISFGNSNRENNNLESARSSSIQSLYQKRDMVNYKVLEGHKYEIRENPNREKTGNKRIYIWKYDNCNREFTKTWNMVSHFRVHTNEKPYQCNVCGKLFTQSSNLTRHLAVHEHKVWNFKKEFHWHFCSRKYSSKYNLNSHVKNSHRKECQMLETCEVNTMTNSSSR